MQRLHLSRVLPHLTQFPARILARARRTPTCWTAVDCSASGRTDTTRCPHCRSVYALGLRLATR